MVNNCYILYFKMSYKADYDTVYTNNVANGLYFILSNSLAVAVEDSSSSCCVTVKVFPHMTTAALKQQVSLKNASPLH